MKQALFVAFAAFMFCAFLMHLHAGNQGWALFSAVFVAYNISMATLP